MTGREVTRSEKYWTWCDKDSNILYKIGFWWFTFPGIYIFSKSKYYHITGINSKAIFATIVTLFEELYLKFVDDDERISFDLSNFDN